MWKRNFEWSFWCNNSVDTNNLFWIGGRKRGRKSCSSDGANWGVQKFSEKLRSGRLVRFAPLTLTTKRFTHTRSSVKTWTSHYQLLRAVTRTPTDHRGHSARTTSHLSTGGPRDDGARGDARDPCQRHRPLKRGLVTIACSRTFRPLELFLLRARSLLTRFSIQFLCVWFLFFFSFFFSLFRHPTHRMLALYLTSNTFKSQVDRIIN